MRTLPTNILQELAGGETQANYLVYLLDLFLSSGQVRLTNADVDIFHEGAWYRSRGLDFGAAEYSIGLASDSVDVEIDNTDLLVSQWVQLQEIRGRRYLHRLAVLDAQAQVMGTMVLFDGLIDSASVSRKRGRIKIHNLMIFWQRRIPRRDHSATCPWTFKAADTCRYVGGLTSCDKSWEQCGARGNTINFGGFRWLPSLQDRQIWWGRVPQ